jgi:hypothetical protein
MHMPYEERQALEARTAALVDSVVDAGEKLGFWKAEPKEQPTEHERNSATRYVRDAEGLRFYINAGSWKAAGKIGAHIASLREGPHHVSPYDVREHYGTTDPEAYASADRGPERVAKDLARRVVQSEEGRACARRVRDGLQRRLTHAASLAEHMAAMRKLGFEFRQHDGSNASSATAWASGIGGCTVDSGGSVRFDHVYVPVDKLAAFVKIIKRD